MDKLIRLHQLDNVLIVAVKIQAGEHLTYCGMEFYFSHAIEIGHKVALKYLETGEKIVMYGIPIGSASRMIQMGDHVDHRNMKSDYLPKSAST